MIVIVESNDDLRPNARIPAIRIKTSAATNRTAARMQTCSASRSLPWPNRVSSMTGLKQFQCHHAPCAATSGNAQLRRAARIARA
jgi:hypothetical protein